MPLSPCKEVGLELTSIGVILLIVGDQQSIALARDGLLIREVLVFDFGKLDHVGGCMDGNEWEVMNDGRRNASSGPTFLPGKSGEELGPADIIAER